VEDVVCQLSWVLCTHFTLGFGETSGGASLACGTTWPLLLEHVPTQFEFGQEPVVHFIAPDSTFLYSQPFFLRDELL